MEDRGAWSAAVHGVTKSHTWLSNWTTTTLSYPLPCNQYSSGPLALMKFHVHCSPLPILGKMARNEVLISVVWRLKHLRNMSGRQGLGEVPAWAESLFQGGAVRCWDAGQLLVGNSAFEHQPGKCHYHVPQQWGGFLDFTREGSKVQC